MRQAFLIIILLIFLQLLITLILVQAEPISNLSSGQNINSVKVYNYVVILVEFSDIKHSIDLQDIRKTLQDLSNYIEEVSYGRYKLNFFLVKKWYVLPKSINHYSYYLDELLWDSIKAADSDVDFSKWQRVIIVHAGEDAAFTNDEKDIRSQYFSVGCGAPARTNDGVLISSAIIVSEYSTLGVYVHEFLHSLGAIDLYGPPGEREKPIGIWDVMATGWRSGVKVRGRYLILGLSPTYPSSWTKIRIGFFRKSDLMIIGPGHHEVEILPLEDQNSGVHAVKIPITSSKYYLIEVREKRGFDSHLPCEGFLIYICDEEATNVGNGILRLIDANGFTPTLDDASFKPGQVFHDREHNLVIRFLMEDNNYKVVIDYKSSNLAIIPSPLKIEENNTIVKAVLKNTGDISIKKADVYVFIDGILKFKKRINNLCPGTEYPITFKIQNVPGKHIILLDAQILDDVIEYDSDDNRVVLTYEVSGKKIDKGEEWPQVVAPGQFARTRFYNEDLDGDKKDEIVICIDSNCYLIDHNGSLIRELESVERLFLDDLDGDGVKDIVSISRNEYRIISLKPGGLNRVFRGVCNHVHSLDLCANDVNNDGIKDIIILCPEDMYMIKSRFGGSLYYYGAIYLRVFDGLTAKILYNFTITTNPEETFEYSYYKHLGYQIGLIGVYDINNDGELEILVGFLKNKFEEELWYNEEAYVLYCYSLNGKLLWRKEIKIPSGCLFRSYVHIYNINSKTKVILVTTVNKIYLLNSNGNVLWSIETNWPRVIGIIEKEVMLFDNKHIKFINIVEGTIRRIIELPEWPHETAFVKLSNRNLILFTTEKGFYIMDENGIILNSITFNTYSWFNLVDNTKAVIYLYNNNSVYIADLISFSISKLFYSKVPGRVIPVNLDNDQEFEYLVFGSFIQTYESNGSIIWTFGLGGYINFYDSKDADLDNDNTPDVVFLKGDFEHSMIIFRNGRVIYDINDATFADLNGDGFSEVVAVSDRGLEVYDTVGNLIWNVPAADFRTVSIGELLSGEKIIAVSVGIFARHINMPPQVRIYSESGKLLKVIGFYWDPPSVHTVKSKTLNESLIIIIGPWSRGEYHLEVYNELGILLFDQLVDSKAWEARATLLDVNNDGIEEIVIPPYVFTLDGRLIRNDYQVSSKKILCIDVDDDEINEYIDVKYVSEKKGWVLTLMDNDRRIISRTQVIKSTNGIYIFKSGNREITVYTLPLTKRGYYVIPIKYYYLDIISSYGVVQGEGLYVANSKANFSVSPVVIDYGNSTRRVLVGWSGDLNISGTEGTIVMDSPKIVIAIWKKQYYLRVTSSYGEVQGEGWYDEGAMVTVSISSITINYENSTRRVFLGWNSGGTILSNNSTYTFIMNQPYEITAEWKTSYYVQVLSEYGSVLGSGWYDKGTTAIVTISTTNIEGIPFNKVFKGWRDQDGNIVSTSPTYTFTVNQPVTLTAVWKQELNIIVVLIAITTIVLLAIIVIIVKLKKPKRV